VLHQNFTIREPSSTIDPLQNIKNVAADKVMGALSMEQRTGDGQVDNCEWTRRLRITWGPHKRKLRCNGMEAMWSKGAQVAEDEEGTGTGGTVSGRQMAGAEVMRGSHLSARDRALCAHVHIGAAKSGLEPPHFWARCVSLADT
jgi:hypothetical protein